MEGLLSQDIWTSRGLKANYQIYFGGQMDFNTHEILQKLYDDDAGKYTELKNFLEQTAKSNYVHFYKLEREAVEIVEAFDIKRRDYIKPWEISPAGNLDKKTLKHV